MTNVVLFLTSRNFISQHISKTNYFTAKFQISINFWSTLSPYKIISFENCCVSVNKHSNHRGEVLSANTGDFDVSVFTVGGHVEVQCGAVADKVGQRRPRRERQTCAQPASFQWTGGDL